MYLLDLATAALQPVSVATPPGAALQQLGFDHFIHHMSPVDAVVLVILVIMSGVSWILIIFNAIRNALVGRRADRVVRAFWNAGSAPDSVRVMEAQPRGEPFSKIALDCASAAAHHRQSDDGNDALAASLDRSEFIDRALRQAIARESVRMETGLTFLATVGSAAVYVGLFGTVIGIYHALIRIGGTGDASITTVAGPVGEALIMTALGLFTAIPAVMAYNFFVRSNRLIFARFDEFAHDLHDFFATGSRVSADVVAK